MAKIAGSGTPGAVLSIGPAASQPEPALAGASRWSSEELQVIFRQNQMGRNKKPWRCNEMCAYSDLISQTSPLVLTLSLFEDLRPTQTFHLIEECHMCSSRSQRRRALAR